MSGRPRKPLPTSTCVVNMGAYFYPMIVHNGPLGVWQELVVVGGRGAVCYRTYQAAANFLRRFCPEPEHAVWIECVTEESVYDGYC